MKKTFLSLVFSIVTIVMQAALGLGDTFTVDSLSYYVSNASATAPEAVVTGLSTQGKNVANLALAVHASVTYGGVTYAVKETNSEAFASQTNITSARLDYGITTVSSRMFKNCENLRRVDLPSSLEYINNNAFQGCSKLADVTCAVADPSKLNIGLSPFPSNSGMTLHVARTDASMQWRYKKISAFSNFSIVKDSEAYDLEAADGMRMCITSDFANGWASASIVGFRYTETDHHMKPTGGYTCARGAVRAVEIADSAFMNTMALCTVDLRNLKYVKVIGTRAFSKAFHTFQTRESEWNVYLPFDLEVIKDYAFEKSHFITDVRLGEKVRDCSPNFFDDGDSFEYISVSDYNQWYSSVNGVLYNKKQTKLIRYPVRLYEEVFAIRLTTQSIEPYAFKGCTRVYTIDLPYGITSVGDGAFMNCENLNQLKVPSSVNSWGKDVCYNTPKLTDLFFNCKTPPQASVNEFKSSPKTTLYVPYESVSAYKNANVWNTWGTIRPGGYDIKVFEYCTEEGKKYEHNVYYTVVSNRPENVNGVDYIGRAQLNRVVINMNNDIINVPNGVESRRGYSQYAVTSIGPEILPKAYGNVTVNLGENVDTICANAFKGITNVKTLTLNPGLKVIGDNAFYDCRIANDIHLPYGLQKIGKGAFYNNSFKVFHIPSSVRTYGSDMISKCNYLTDLIINSNWMYNGNWDLTNISTSCRLYVPTGYVYQYKGNSALGKLQISAGAYDFTYNNADMNNSLYHITVTDANPVTVDGVTYDGKAKYVCHPAHKTLTNTSFTASLYEADITHGGSKKYLMTEMADSVLDGCKQITRVSISSMAHLQRIGAWAFCLTGITGFTVPSTCTYIGKGAFAYADKLSSLTLMAPTSGTRTWGGQFFYNNASNFKCYVKWNEYTQYKNAISTWTRYSSESNAPIDRLNSYFQMNNDKGATTFSVAHPVDWNSAIGLNAYVVKSYDATKKQVTTQKMTATPAGTGVLVTDYTNGGLYRLNRPSTTPSAPTNLLVGNTDASVNVTAVSVGYSFDATAKDFWRPNYNLTLAPGSAYLKLTSAQAGTTTKIAVDLWPKAIKGDVNGDGVVNVSDVTALINKILGTATYADAVCDINGDGQVNVSDVTALINMILG